MPSETDVYDSDLPEKDDLGEGAETYQVNDDDGGVSYEDDQAGNDLIDDAELAAGQLVREDDERNAAIADRKHHKALKDSFDCSDPLPANPGAD